MSVEEWKSLATANRLIAPCMTGTWACICLTRMDLLLLIQASGPPQCEEIWVNACPERPVKIELARRVCCRPLGIARLFE